MFKGPVGVFCFLLCPLVLAQQPQAPQPPQSNPTTTPQTVPAGPPPPDTLLDGTPVKLRLSQTMSSADAKTGQDVPFEVVEDVKVDGVVVLPKGATAIGNVTDAQPKRRMGRGGKLDITISYARLADKEKVALRASQGGKGGGHVGAMTGAMVGTAIVFFPAAPLFLFMHGKDITIPQGTEITAFVEGDMHLDMTKFGAAPTSASAATLASPMQASIMIESTPPGADIEVDGAFQGNTPSTLSVKAGDHDITLKKSGFTPWSRKLNVTGGNVHLNAELQAAPADAAPVSSPAPSATPQ